jgi:hypothetical protein
MREIRLSGSEGGGTKLIGSPYPCHQFVPETEALRESGPAGAYTESGGAPFCGRGLAKRIES